MNESSHEMTDERLEAALRAIAAEVEYPPTPALASAVRDRIDAGEAARPLRLPTRPRWQTAAFAAAALLIALAGTLTFSPHVRNAVADFIGIDGVRIGYGEQPPAPPRDLDLGPRVSLEAAERRVGFEVKLPTAADLGPSEVHITEPPEGGMVSLFYPDAHPSAREPGLLITQFRADIDAGFFKKLVFEDAQVQYVRVRGTEGYWVLGAHFFYYFDENGSQYEETVRLAANVLLWEEDGITYRIEGEIDRAEAERIAESLR